MIGSPIRKEILNGSADKGRLFLGFDHKRPILTIMGGSLGAKKINEVVRSSIKPLTQHFQVVHLCGKNNTDHHFSSIPGYRQFEYVHEELSRYFSCYRYSRFKRWFQCHFRIFSTEYTNVNYSLGLQQSRGDQILNAQAFQEKGYSLTLKKKN